MDNENKEKKTFLQSLKSFFAAIGRGFIKCCKTVGGWIARMFMGASKSVSKSGQNGNLSDALKVEEVLSPTRQYIRAFKEKKLAMGALIVVIAMFLFVFIGPLFMPEYSDIYKSSSQKNLPPNLSMLSLPSELNGKVKDISSNSYYTLGLSDEGKIYIWGVTKVANTGKDMKKDMPEELKTKKTEFIAAGADHAIAITDDGTVYAWGHNQLGQYINSEEDVKNQETNHNILMMPEDIRFRGKVDVSNVKKVVAGNQLSAILFKDGSFKIWGNINNYRNASNFAKDGVKMLDIDMTNSQVYGVTESGRLETFVGGLEEDGVTRAVKLKYTMTGIALNQYNILGENKIESVVCATQGVMVLVDESAMGLTKRGMFSGDFSSAYTEPPKLGKNRYFVKIAAGAENYAGLTNDGTVYVWGDNTHGQLKSNGTTGATDVFAESYQVYVENGGKIIAKSGLNGYIFGTDDNGASVFQRLVNGGKMTLTVGAIAVIISSVIGIIIGVLSGYFGGTVDMILMRVTEIVSAIPFLPFAMILSAIMGTMNFTENQRIFIIMVILGVLSWTGLARLVRGQVLATRENEYVTAAKAMGVSEAKIAFKHILPNVISVIIVTLTLDFAGCMLTESSLSYLGFGVQAPKPTWGNMLNATTNLTTIANYWWRWLFPSIFLAITTICINMIGDALRDVMDPRTNKR